MKVKKLDSSYENEKLDQETIKMLFVSVFPRMSNLAVFNLAYFFVGGSTEADDQLREALNQELFRRGLVTTPDLYNRDINVDKFSDDDMESVNMWFAGDDDPDGLTHEDTYVRLLTGRDRWAERKRPKRKRRAAKKTGTPAPTINEDEFEDEDEG